MRDRTYSHGSELSTNDTLLQTSTTRSYHLPSHDHALLESLHTAVYSSRFINMNPLCTLFLDFSIVDMVELIFCSHFAELFDHILQTSLLGTHYKFSYATVSSNATFTSTASEIVVRDKVKSALPSRF